MPELRRDEEEWLRRFWEEKKPTRMTFIELRNLYIYTKNRAKELGVPDPETTAKELLDRVFDPSLTYAENLGLVDAELIKLGVPTELPKELEELEFYKKKVEELEKKLKRAGVEEIERIRDELKRLRREFREAIRRLTEEIREVRERERKRVEERRVEEEKRPRVEIPEKFKVPLYHPEELIPPTMSQLRKYFKTIVNAMRFLALRIYGRDLNTLTARELGELFNRVKFSFPRQAYYFVWLRMNQPEVFNKWWREEVEYITRR